MIEGIYEAFKGADLVGHKRGRAGFLLKNSAKRRKKKDKMKSQAEGPNPETDVIAKLVAKVEKL